MCIGITCWGNIYNRNELTMIGETVDYHPFNRFISENTEDIGVNLEKSHTHFLLVDDGYVNKCTGGEMEFRSKIEDALRTCAIKGSSVSYFSYFPLSLTIVEERGQNNFRHFSGSILGGN